METKPIVQGAFAALSLLATQHLPRASLLPAGSGQGVHVADPLLSAHSLLSCPWWKGLPRAAGREGEGGCSCLIIQAGSVRGGLFV